MSNASFGTTGLIASTIEKWIPSLVEQIFSSKPFLWALENAGAIEDADGGLSIVQPLIYAESANVGSYADYDVFATDPNTGISAAEFPWRQFYGLLHISGIEAAMNGGKQAVLNLLESRGKQLKMSMSEEIERQLLDDGSGNNGKDFDGLAAIVSNADPSWGDLGGIDRGANAYWQSTVTDFNAATITGLQASMRTLYNTISKGNENPNLGLASQLAYEAYEGQLIDQLRFNDSDMADGGFQNLLFKGMPITFSEYADRAFTVNAVAHAEDPIWFLNLDYIHLRKLASVWFKPTDMASPVNQDAGYQSILCYGNLTTSNPSRQGVLHSVTVAA
jgi:hypothetical protein